ncbi:MAG: hypothetical protein DRP78_01850 [Candidatus Omnitrophota bacterium]|nr:MAG: hypothetical protein DRP78_01850 [Candidatus Omnitrophota bacterium]
MAEKTLSQLSPGDQAKVVKVAGAGLLKRKILDMGIINGVDIKVERVAPLGDPIEIMVRGYHLSLRKQEAVNIYVEL